MPIDPRVLCCAAGACCQEGSPEQAQALAEVFTNLQAQCGEDNYSLAKEFLKLFKLEERKPARAPR